MSQAALSRDTASRETASTETAAPAHPRAVDTRRLGRALRSVYEAGVDKQPIPDAQVELLLRLRHRERDLRRVG